ncbi:hypothetical protein SERLADRAFT_391144 [Serpula lacrymans var. lacrymans S7.9]|uniref:Uncharacterized protein n=1 Tax=Serpula lacrymans var. lacrymans (strain S7.9) TaxID=578457 RepID=F8NWM1_SERL9|nr:uncharacterized protein SERLADRAFT_391144 [Serpula lacrymans var. lacrymans S7.9]EGO25045.1 hypothetical protein SERLADRAFT_391144 [Serpula lacrymans var. lacrymans S7.9]
MKRSLFHTSTTSAKGKNYGVSFSLNCTIYNIQSGAAWSSNAYVHEPQERARTKASIITISLVQSAACSIPSVHLQ